MTINSESVNHVIIARFDLPHTTQCYQFDILNVNQRARVLARDILFLKTVTVRRKYTHLENFLTIKS